MSDFNEAAKSLDRARTTVPVGTLAKAWAEKQPTSVLLDYLRTKSESHAGTVDLAAVRAEIDSRIPCPWMVRHGVK